MSRRTGPWMMALLLAGPTAGAAQHLPDPVAVAAGAEFRLYDFGAHLGVRRLWQVATPAALTLPRRRFTLDAGAWHATTTIERRDGTRTTVSGLTDLQVRASYVFGSDAIVITAVANLPTGAERLSASEYGVLAAASSSFLAFPVNAYSTGLSVTAGAAAAVVAGSWNLGLAASGRLSGEFTPFVDTEGSPFTYRAGPEVRVRAAADRTIGAGRLAVAFTWSTFSTDEYGPTTPGIGRYRPGERLIAEAFLTTGLGRGTVTAYVWNFFRTSGDSVGVSAGNRENLLAGGLVASVPWTGVLSLEPGAESRWSRPEVGQAFLLELSAALRARLRRHTTVVATPRVTFGRLEEAPPGIGHALRGGGLSVFLRQSF
jgi:hypothetical protein